MRLALFLRCRCGDESYRLLELNVSLDVYELELFKAYLALPRKSVIILPRIAEGAGGFAARLDRDYSGLMISPPIVDEEPLVGMYFEHFLRDAADTSQFDGLLKPDYLTRVFAETKLLNVPMIPNGTFRCSHPQSSVSRRSGSNCSSPRKNWITSLLCAIEGAVQVAT